MRRTLLRWLFRVTALLFILLVLALGGLYLYIENNYERIARSAAHEIGLELDFKELDLRWWQDFPILSLEGKDIQLRDTLASSDIPTPLQLDSFYAKVGLGSILSDTIRLKSVYMARGRVEIERMADGRLNTGDLFNGAGIKNGESKWILDPHKLDLSVNQLEIFYEDTLDRKLFDLDIQSLSTSVIAQDRKRPILDFYLEAQVRGLALNTDKGSYLQNSTVRGSVPMRIGNDTVHIDSTTLEVNDQSFQVSAQFADASNPGVIYLACQELAYEQTRVLLHDTLRQQLKNYRVSGTFPVEAKIVLLAKSRHPEIYVDFRFDGQNVRIFNNSFKQVYTYGTYQNRLTVAEGGIADSHKNNKFELGPLSGFIGGVRIQSPGAFVAATAEQTSLRAPLKFSGSARAMSKQLGNQNFLFEDGDFTLSTEIDGSLDHIDDLIAASDGVFELQDFLVRYKPTGALLRLDRLVVTKTGEDIIFDLERLPGTRDLAFELEGKLDHLTPLLLDRPGQELTSDIAFYAPYFSWTDFLNYFGDEGHFGAVSDSSTISKPQESMRKTLLGLRKTFHPTIHANIDTIRYGQLFTLTEFESGLHFAKDTLILEQTTFQRADSEFALDARMDFSQSDFTPFDLNAKTSRLNLNQLRPTLDHFGLDLPKELDQLPSDLNIDFHHSGRLQDDGSMSAGYNRGMLKFSEGSQKRYSGLLTYQPESGVLRSHFQMRGDPSFVNTLFLAETFFFNGGQFELNLMLDGTPKNFSQLFDYGDLSLRVDSSRIEYYPADVYFPVQHFLVDIKDREASFELDVTTLANTHPVHIDGTLNDISAFLFPALKRTYQVDANVTSPYLETSDIQRMVRSMRADNSSDFMSGGSIFETIEGVFASFSPDLKLQIDTFKWSDNRLLRELRAHLVQDEAGVLHLSESGFISDQGNLQLSARFPVDDLRRSPFFAQFKLEDFHLNELIDELNASSVLALSSIGDVDGRLNVNGHLTGQIDEYSGQLLLNSLQGQANVDLQNFEIIESESLVEIGIKTLMKKRFEHIRFAPLQLGLTIDTGRIDIPRFELQSTAIQLFMEGHYDLLDGPNMLITLPLRNIWRGQMSDPPAPTGFARSGWKVNLVLQNNKEGVPKTKFRLGRRRYYKQLGLLDEYRAERKQIKQQRREIRKEKRALGR